MIYTERPKSGTGKLAWDRFKEERGIDPYSVEYTPSYSYQYRGWICEWFEDGSNLVNYGVSRQHTFYHSSELSYDVD